MTNNKKTNDRKNDNGRMNRKTRKRKDFEGPEDCLED